MQSWLVAAARAAGRLQTEASAARRLDFRFQPPAAKADMPQANAAAAEEAAAALVLRKTAVQTEAMDTPGAVTQPDWGRDRRHTSLAIRAARFTRAAVHPLVEQAARVEAVPPAPKERTHSAAVARAGLPAEIRPGAMAVMVCSSFAIIARHREAA